MFDAVIIGAGPGGYSCALNIAQLGGKIALIEAQTVGGTCTNRGCIPTKALASSAELIEELKNSARKGISISDFKIDFTKIMERKNRIVQGLVRGIELNLKNPQIEFIAGCAKIISSNKVEVNGQILEAKNIVLATGSAPISIFSGDKIIDSTAVLNLSSLPQKLAIIGGGVIGVELGYIFQTLGSQVTIIEALPNILFNLDTDLQQELHAALKRKGVNILTNQKATFINEKLIVNNAEIPCDLILVAVGRKAVFPQIDSSVNLQVQPTNIPVNEHLQTNVPNIYAVGDITGHAQLAHVADKQGACAAANIMGKPQAMNYSAIPSCIYTNPEIGSVGVREQDVNPEEVIIKKANFAANAKARCTDQLFGFIKVIADKKTQQILGVHILGPRATDLITNAVTLLNNKQTLDALHSFIYPHPTFGEIFSEI